MIDNTYAYRELLGKSAASSFGAVSINVASPEVIRSWSFGEVKNPETINYRSFKPEKGGLFCERIFGPTRDWECNCGKYKRVKHKGIVCDRCGVEVTQAKVRRERMGHIELAVPVSHIWFFKCMPSRIGLVLDMTAKSLEHVIYYEEYVVTDPGDTPLKVGQTMNEIEYRQAVDDYGDAFTADMGAPAIKTLLERVDMPMLKAELEVSLEGTRNKAIRKKLAKRLRLVEGFMVEEHNNIPAHKHLTVSKGDFVRKGQKLTEGSIVPHTLLEICGVHELQRHLVDAIQLVYRAQGVEINDKHVEIIIRQMMQKVRITDSGSTDYLPGEQLDRTEFDRVNREMIEKGGKPAEAEPILLGITKAALETESFISAASFQDTTRILTEAATVGKVDNLNGFKENVITGHLIPAGTGTEVMQSIRLKYLGTEIEPELAVQESERSVEEIAAAWRESENKSDAAIFGDDGEDDEDSLPDEAREMVADFDDDAFSELGDDELDAEFDEEEE